MAETFKLLGAERMRRTFRRIRTSINRGIAADLFQEGERIMAASKKQVPVDTGALKSSGIVEPPVVLADSVSVTLGYGGPAVPYALKVHEVLQARHTVGNALYLERPFLEELPAVQRRLGFKLTATIRGRILR